MGRLKKRFNAKARQKSELHTTNVDKNLEKAVLETDTDKYQNTQDGSNALVILSNKTEKGKQKGIEKKTGRVLSKKQRKKLEKIVEQKKKKEKRADVLKSLAECQVSGEELSLYKSTSKIGQVINIKRKSDICVDTTNVTSIGKRKRKRAKQNTKFGFDNAAVPMVVNKESSDESLSTDDISENELDYCDNDENKKNVIKEQTLKKDNSTEKDGIITKNVVEDSTVVMAVKEDENDQDDIKENLLQNSKPAPVVTSGNYDDLISEKDGLKEQKKAFIKPIYVEVKRTAEIQAARLLLPILPEEQVIMEVIQASDVVVICGSTGSGKTTQVPQFLYEAGYGTHESRSGMIGITEPRRVAAVSMSRRVAEEMNMSNRMISYQIRYEGNTTDDTVMKFMTDGVLLKEMENDFLLTKYSVLIIDEAHERSVYTDILIGLLSRVVPLRKKQNNPLRLIIMSATLRVEDFTENKRLFSLPPPVLKVDSRQYPVTIHFNRRTQEDYVSEAFKKVCKIHRTLKLDGGILVFLTGQNEVLALCRKLQRAFPNKYKKSTVSATTIRKKKKTKYTDNEDCEDDGGKEKKQNNNNMTKIDLDSYAVDVDKTDDTGYDDVEDDDDNDLITTNHLDSDDYDDGYKNTSDDELDDSAYTAAVDASLPMHVLPLYSLLSTSKQSKVFSDPPEGHRLCVIATNVAETSLTIPGIKYIVDSGKVKKKFYDKVTGVSTFRIVWTSKASANQRAGRAGRIGPGHCYRLFSSAVFQNDFEEFSEPDICRRPVDDLILQMKAMCIDKVLNFPFPTPPDTASLQAAEKLLLDLGALKKQKTKQGNEIAVLTTLGRSLSKIPVSPRFSKMIYLSSKHDGCLQFVIAIVAALTVKEIFTDDIDFSNIENLEADDIKEKQKLITAARRRWAGDGPSSLLGDLMVILRAVGACEYAGCSEEFCAKNGLRHKAMIEIRKLRAQLTNAVNTVHGIKGVFVDPKMTPPNEQQAVVIRQIVLSGLADHVARKIPPDEAKSLKIKNAYRSCSTEDPVFIHPTSSLFTKLPEYIVYHEIMETKKLYMKIEISSFVNTSHSFHTALLTIQEEWLSVHASHMCMFGKPMEDPVPQFCSRDGCVKAYISCTFGPHVWQLQPRLLRHPESPEYYRWFAKYLLEGDVIPKLKEFSEYLVTPASVMVKSWSHLQEKTERLYRTLAAEEVNSREKLLKTWETKPKYLLQQYLQWVLESQHDSVRMKWPPIG